MKLTPENRAAVERELAKMGCGTSYITTVGGGLHLDSWSMLNALLNAARADAPGLEPDWDQGHDPDADCLKAPR